MKKLVAIVITLILCMSVVATTVACTPRALPNFEVPEEGFDTQTPVTITFYHNMGQTLESQFNDAVASFNKLYPNITIEPHKLGTYEDLISQIRTQLGNGQSPNLAYCYPDHVATYDSYSAVVTLDNLIKSDLEITRADGQKERLGFTDEQLDDFVDVFYEEGTAMGDGLMYVLPLSKSTEVMYYNKTYFDENNLKVPTHWFANGENDETSMEYVCERILAISKENNIKAVPFGYDSEDNWFITLAEQMGAEYTTNTGNNPFLFNNKKNRDMMAKLREWYEKGYFITKSLYGVNGQNTSSLLTNTTDATSPRAYMSVGSTGGSSYNIPKNEPVFETGVAPVPQLDPNNPKYILQGPDVCIFKKENPQEVLASWLFLKFLTTDIDFQAGYAQVSGYMPVLKSVYEKDEIFQEFLSNTEGNANLQARVVKMSVEQLRDNCFTSPAFNGSATARQQVGSLLVTCISTMDGVTDVTKFIEQSFKDAIDECNYTL